MGAIQIVSEFFIDFKQPTQILQIPLDAVPATCELGIHCVVIFPDEFDIQHAVSSALSHPQASPDFSFGFAAFVDPACDPFQLHFEQGGIFVGAFQAFITRAGQF